MSRRRSLAHREAHEAPDDDVLARRRRELAAQLLDRLAVVLVAVDVGLVEQHDLLGEGDEVVVLGHEVGVAVDLDEHADLAVGVDVALDGALAGLTARELADLAPHLDAQDLDGAIDVPFGLLQRRLAVHHPRARLLAQGGDVLGADLDLVGHAFCSWVSGAGSLWASASAVVVWLSASTSLAGGGAGGGGWLGGGGVGSATSAWRSSASASWSA